MIVSNFHSIEELRGGHIFSVSSMCYSDQDLTWRAMLKNEETLVEAASHSMSVLKQTSSGPKQFVENVSF